jgi:hypothetical protein
MKEIKDLIAKSIKAADNSYFWENYIKQAESVLKALNTSGFAIVPKEPRTMMVQAGVHAVIIGKTKPHELASQIYKAMVSSCMVK